MKKGMLILAGFILTIVFLVRPGAQEWVVGGEAETVQDLTAGKEAETVQDWAAGEEAETAQDLAAGEEAETVQDLAAGEEEGTAAQRDQGDERWQPLSFCDNPQAIEAAAAGVVKLEVFDRNDRRIANGSGYCAFDSQILVTAKHVLVNADHIRATRDDGETFEVGKILNISDNSDVAICLIPEDAGLTPLPVSDSTLMRGEKVTAIGSMYGLTNMVLIGNICGLWNASDSDWILFTAPVSPGCSGGPVFGSDGRVVGTVMGSYEKAESLNLASPIAVAEILYRALTEQE